MSQVTGSGSGAIVRQGHLRKLKTMKKKYFVVRAETPDCSARLEYYESEKKFRSGAAPRRAISLKSCYNITRRLDLKQKHVIALFTREEQFCVVAENEQDLHSWLSAILRQHRADDASEELQHPIQHVWQVNVQKKGLGASKNIQGLYNLCLTDKTLTLVKIKSHNNIISDLCIPEKVEYSLKNIRRCGDSECFFYMEVGRQTSTGAGELWMHTDDSNIAQSMHSTIYHAMRNCAKESENDKDHIAVPKTTEGTAPTAARRQTFSETRPRPGLINDVAAPRSRCDSMPSRISDADRVPPRLTSDLVEGAAISRDDVDAAGMAAGEWHRTPRIPEEPDYCEMGPRDLMSTSRTSSSVQHSRTSSMGFDEVEGVPVPLPPGYVPMAPAHEQMSTLVSAQSGSVCSGTPSTDPRFSEYQLDPATSHIIDEERVTRAYSVGSRPTASQSVAETTRHRAYSVGARTRGPPPARTSTSAPLLADDLMELDFSNNSTPARLVVARTPPRTVPFPRTQDEYVDMSPRTQTEPTRIPVDTGYVDMKPGEPLQSVSSASEVATTPDGYVEMNYSKAPTRPIAIASVRSPINNAISPQTPADDRSKRNGRTPLGSQTIFPLSLDSPASPSRPEDRDLDVLSFEDEPHHPLTTVREISEEGRRSPEMSTSPSYVTLARTVSKPIAAPPKLSDPPLEELSCNPTATKNLSRLEVNAAESNATLVKAGGGAPARFNVGSPDPPEQTLHYAALDLEPKPGGAAPPPRLYTKIDFVRSEKLHADAN